MKLYFNAIKTLLEIANDKGFSNNYYPNMNLIKHQHMLFQSNSNAFDMHFKNDKKKLIITFVNSTLLDNLENLNEKMNNLINIYKIQKTDDIIIVFDKNDVEKASSLMKIYKFQNLNTSVLTIQFLQFNVSKHVFVPKHSKLNNIEIKQITKQLKIKSLNQLPFIFVNDPQCKYHGFRLHDVIKIERVSKTNSKSISYRYVVENDVETNEINYDSIIDKSYHSINETNKNEEKEAEDKDEKEAKDKDEKDAEDKDEKDEKEAENKDNEKDNKKDENKTQEPNKCTSKKNKICEEKGKICNAKTGRCKKKNTKNNEKPVNNKQNNTKCSESKIKFCEKKGKICNPKTGRCKKK